METWDVRELVSTTAERQLSATYKCVLFIYASSACVGAVAQEYNSCICSPGEKEVVLLAGVSECLYFILTVEQIILKNIKCINL